MLFCYDMISLHEIFKTCLAYILLFFQGLGMEIFCERKFLVVGPLFMCIQLFLAFEMSHENREQEILYRDFTLFKRIKMQIKNFQIH